MFENIEPLLNCALQNGLMKHCIDKCIINIFKWWYKKYRDKKLFLSDQILPSITCPRNLVTVSANIWQGIPHIKYNNTSVIAVDNSGHVSILYDPPDGAAITASETLLVTASAVDGSLNTANCSFFARVECKC